MYQPKFSYTHNIVKALISIERSRVIVEMLPLPANVEEDLRTNAKIKMAHYSTRIEGNPLDFKEVSQVIRGERDRKGVKAEQEVRNYWDALTFLSTSKKMKIVITENFVKRLHSIIEVRGSGRRSRVSEYRGPMPPGVLFAVYDEKSKKPEYIPPEASDVLNLMKEFILWINSAESAMLPVPIKAAIATYQLLTIHPFEDGNGRTSRALATYILSAVGYDLKGFNSMEEYYVADLKGYYSNLQMNLPILYYDGRNNPPDLAPWIEHFVLVMDRAFDRVATIATSHYDQQIDPRVKSLEPKEKIVLRLLLTKSGSITPKEIAKHFLVEPRTISKWSKIWLIKGIIAPASGDMRVRSYKIGVKFSDLSLDDLGYLDQTFYKE